VALVAVVLVLAAVVGVAGGGRPGALAQVPLAGWRLLVAAGVCQVGGSVISRLTDANVPYAVGSLAAVALLIGFLLHNTRLAGVPLVAVGLLANTVVVLANGAMPVSRWAAAKAGVDLHDIAAGLDARHVVAGATTSARVLSDVIPVRIPWWPEVVSPGDVLVAAGLGLLLVTGLLWPRTRQTRHSEVERSGDELRETTRASASTTPGSYS
jgi:Family of unknown function (DUF5317)